MLFQECALTWLCCVQMTQKIMEAEGEGDPEQLDFFLKGNLALEKNARRKPHAWLPDQVSCNLLQTRLLARHLLGFYASKASFTDIAGSRTTSF